jgi:hypothetical protein
MEIDDFVGEIGHATIQDHRLAPHLVRRSQQAYSPRMPGLWNNSAMSETSCVMTS